MITLLRYHHRTNHPRQRIQHHHPSLLRSLLFILLTLCLLAAAASEDGNATTLEIDANTIDTPSGNSNATILPLAVGDGTVVARENIQKVAADAILFPWFVQLFGCCALFVLTRFNLPVPFAAVMFIAGALLGYWSVLETRLENSDARRHLQDSVIMWTNIDSGSLLLVFLPGLIFKDAVDIPINLFLVAFAQIWLLAFPMVLYGTGLTAVIAKYCLPYEGESEYFGWWAWIILGAILASTDPIAVASVLKTAGASPRLVMHIAGESLMNDGSSYVFFKIAANMWFSVVGLPVQDDIGTWGRGIAYFLRMSVGGTLVGTIFGFGLLGVIWELDRRMERDFDILQVVFGLTTAYLCYYVCDQMLTMSGVIATVACGIVVNRFGRGLIHDKEMMSSYLALADFLLNTLLFALGGVIWAAISFSTQESDAVDGRAWGYLIIFYMLCMVIRFVQVGTFYPILSRIGLKSNWKEGVFLAYGGLHGSVGVALGLSLVQYVFQFTEDRDLRNAATILQFLGGGATFLTLTINGTTAGGILKLLGLVKPPVSAEYVKRVFEGTAKDFVYNEMAKLFREQRFQDVSFDVLKEHVPFVSKEPPRYFGEENIATIQKFHQHVAADGKPYIALLNATERAANCSEDRRSELLVEMRQIFLELLGEAYKLQEETGELAQDQHNGMLLDVFLQSVNLAVNEVRYDKKPIEDWQHTEIFFRWDQLLAGRSSAHIFSEFSEDFHVSNRIQRRITDRSFANTNIQPISEPPRHSSNISITESLMSKFSMESNDQFNKKMTQTTMRRIRVDVLRALAFRRGHKMAQAKLRLYVNRFDDDEDESMRARQHVTEEILQTILSESRAQIALAEEMLKKEVSDKDLATILSHYCAKILVRRLQRFTEEKSEEGMIGKQETRTYIRRMKDIIKQIDARTVDRLAESRVEEKSHGHRRVFSDAMQSILEDGSSICSLDFTGKAPSSLTTNSEKGNTADSRRATDSILLSPLPDSFEETPPESSENSRPKIEIADIEQIDRKEAEFNKGKSVGRMVLSKSTTSLTSLVGLSNPFKKEADKKRGDKEQKERRSEIESKSNGRMVLSKSTTSLASLAGFSNPFKNETDKKQGDKEQMETKSAIKSKSNGRMVVSKSTTSLTSLAGFSNPFKVPTNLVPKLEDDGYSSA